MVSYRSREILGPAATKELHGWLNVSMLPRITITDKELAATNSSPLVGPKWRYN